MKRIIILLSLIILSLALVSCSRSGGDEVVQNTYSKGETVYLNVYNWGEYISDGSEGTLDANLAFEEYFNSTLSDKYNGIKIKVVYSTYATNEDMYSKLKNSAVSYDIVIPSDYMIQKMAEEGMLYEFDVEEDIANFVNIDPSFKSPYYDKNNRYSVPYTYGMMGIIYNTTMVDEEDIDAVKWGWGLLWSEKYKGQILQFNNPRDAFATAMYWKGLDVNSDDPDVWDRALELLKEQKPLLQGYVSDEIFDKMRGESAAIAPYFAGDYLTMKDEEENLSFYYPSEGVNYFVDAMCIPVTSKNRELAKEYINFMLSEEVAVANAEYIGYASPNLLVQNNEDYIDSLSDEAYEILYESRPTEINAEYIKKYGTTCYESFSPDIQARVNTLWENLKLSGSTELWVHITSITIVVAVLAFAIYSIYVKKKRSRHYRKRQ